MDCGRGTKGGGPYYYYCTYTRTSSSVRVYIWVCIASIINHVFSILLLHLYMQSAHSPSSHEAGLQVRYRYTYDYGYGYGYGLCAAIDTIFLLRRTPLAERTSLPRLTAFLAGPPCRHAGCRSCVEQRCVAFDGSLRWSCRSPAYRCVPRARGAPLHYECAFVRGAWLPYSGTFISRRPLLASWKKSTNSLRHAQVLNIIMHARIYFVVDWRLLEKITL